jgi:hypothetical protein
MIHFIFFLLFVVVFCLFVLAFSVPVKESPGALAVGPSKVMVGNEDRFHKKHTSYRVN